VTITTPQKYRKKPVVIDAMPNTGGSENHVALARWMPEVDIDFGPEGEVYIGTLEGTMRADVGDWIIRGVKGEFYPCKPDIFDATYEGAGS
jgi:hypothetical protein